MVLKIDNSLLSMNIVRKVNSLIIELYVGNLITTR